MVSLDTYEASELAVGLQHRVGEHRADVAGVSRLPRLQALVDGDLLLVVVADGEGHQAVESQVALAVFGEQLRGGPAELEPLRDVAFADAEAAGYLGGALAAFDEAGKRLELVGRVHGLPHGVFHQAQLEGVAAVADLAGHGKVRRQLALLLQLAEGFQASAAGDDAVAAVTVGGDHQVLHQAVGED